MALTKINDTLYINADKISAIVVDPSSKLYFIYTQNIGVNESATAKSTTSVISADGTQLDKSKDLTPAGWFRFNSKEGVNIAINPSKISGIFSEVDEGAILKMRFNFLYSTPVTVEDPNILAKLKQYLEA